MSPDEKARLFRWAARGSVPFYAGVAAVRTQDAVALARSAEAAGAQGLLVGFPPYVRLTPGDARAYLKAVCQASGLPVMLYNNPLRTAFDLVPSLLEVLVDENPTVRAVKETGDASRAPHLKATLGGDFFLFSGSDRSIADHWDLGYDGLTSVAGNLWATEMSTIVADLEAGRGTEARSRLEELTPALQTVVEPHLPASLKYGLRALGLPGGWCREPLGHLEAGVEAGIRAALATSFEPDSVNVHPFWDDEHISAQMLEAHLDPSHDAASRRPGLRQRTLDWLRKQVLPPAGRVADLGCGPGLYSLELARLGYEVEGIDLSRRSIAHARDEAAREGLSVVYRNENYLDLVDQERFDAALMIWCDMGALTGSERRHLLGRILQALKPGGVLVFDVWGREGVDAVTSARTWSRVEKGFWSARPHLLLEESVVHPNVVARRIAVWEAGAEPKVYFLRDYWFDDPGLVELVSSCGFDDVHVHSGVLGEPGTEEGRVKFVTARRPVTTSR